MSRMMPLARQGGLQRLVGAGLVAATALCWTAAADARPAPESFAPLAKRVAPAVVNIAISKEAVREEGQMPSVPPGSPFEEFFKHFGIPMPDGRGGSDGSGRPLVGLGSGFIVDPSGYIVTNNHVVDRADEVKVRLDDDSSFTAEVVGVDPQTDLALLKVDAGRPLPSVSFGDSDSAEIGDWVMAVGNPFGLGGTVTAGIVSARGRNIHAGPYDDFLQVDAAINRGNSGGPLFNVDGEVIGVNTAIYSPTGGSVGIGFAIPSNLVKNVVAALREHGKVDRGWLGVSIQEVTPEIAESLGLDKAEGTLIANVQPGGPAARAGLRQGDVVRRFAGQNVAGPRELARVVATKPAGSEVRMEVWRDGRSRDLDVVTGRQPSDMQTAMQGPGGGQQRPDGSFHSNALNADLASLDDELRQRLGIADGVEGVAVLKIGEGSMLEEQVREGDVIVRFGGDKVDSPERLEALVQQAKRKEEKAVLVLVNRQGNDLFLGLKLGLA